MAENKVRFPGVVGPSYTLRSERFDAQETINYYIEMDELGAGKGQEPAVLLPTPGLDFLQTIGSGPIRCMYTQSNDQITYIVSGNEIYYITGGLSTPIRVTGNLTTSIGPVQATDNGFTVIFVDGINGYTLDVGTTTLNTISDPHFYPTDTITYQDGMFIGVEKGSQGFFTSSIVLPNTSTAVTWPDLNISYAEGNPDILVASISNNRQLINFGAKSTEFFYNAGIASTNPFVRQDGRQSQIGCIAPASIAVLSETLLWLGSNAQGGGVVYSLQNNSPARISTHAVERTLQEAGVLSSATAWAYQMEGHYFYLLNVAGLDYTWVYDMTTGMWHKRQSNINGVNMKQIGQTHAVLNNQHLVGDIRNGNIYQLSLEASTEAGNVIYRIRQFPHSSVNLKRVFYNLLECDFQMGVGVSGTVQRSISEYTQYGVLKMSSSGVLTNGNYQPQAYDAASGFSSYNALRSVGTFSGGDYIGVGNQVGFKSPQVPPINVGFNVSQTTTNDARTFFFPMQMAEKIFVTDFTTTTDGYTATVIIGWYATDGRQYSISSINNTGNITVTVTRLQDISAIIDYSPNPYQYNVGA